MGVRANIIHFGGQTEFCPNGFGGGGGVVAEIFRRRLPHPIRGGGSPLNLCVIQTCIVFCQNTLDSLPELMSTNCPNWGAAAPPPSLTPMSSR